MKQYLPILLIIILALITIRHYNKVHVPGTVIILNGPSVAGKSSIQREFQQLMLPDLWIKLGIDNLFDLPMPDINPSNLEFWQSENPIRWVTTTHDKDNNTLITLFTGQEGEKVARGMNSAIAGYANAGCNIIVDYIAYKKEWLDDLRSKLQGIKTVWIKVNIPLDVLEEREIARGTSPKGHARSHYDAVHWDIKYHMAVNSHEKSAAEIAKYIKTTLGL